MSKSLGNFFTVRDLLEGNTPDSIAYPGEVIRFVLLSTHYGKPMDWTADKAKQAQEKLRTWAHLCAGLEEGEVSEDVVFELKDDLNTSEALTELSRIAEDGDPRVLLATAKFLGFDLKRIVDEDWANTYVFEAPDGTVKREGVDYMPTVGVVGWGPFPKDLASVSLDVVRIWLGLRRDKEYEKADTLRTGAESAGLSLRAYRTAHGSNGGQGHLSGVANVNRLKELLK